MDAFGERNKLLFNMEDALAYNKESGKAKKNQDSLFSSDGGQRQFAGTAF